MTRTLLLALALVALESSFGFVRAAPTPKGNAALDLSFVDLDDDGERDAADPPLASFVGPGKIGFNEFAAQPGYTPANRPVGIVIEGTLSLTQPDALLLVLVRGNITVRGTISVRGADSTLSFTTLGGRIDIRPGVVLKGNGELMFRTMQGGSITVGKGAQLSTKGDLADVSLNTEGTLSVATGVTFSLSGSGYSDVELHSVGPMQLASGIKFRGPSHGAVSILSAADLDLAGLDVRMGYIHIESYSNAQHPDAKRVHLRDSTLAQIYKNGDYRVIASPDVNRNRYAADAIVLRNVTVSTKQPPLYSPDPVIE